MGHPGLALAMSTVFWSRFLGEWPPASGERAAPGPCCEVYLNTPATAAPAALRTDMRVPLV